MPSAAISSRVSLNLDFTGGTVQLTIRELSLLWMFWQNNQNFSFAEIQGKRMSKAIL